MLLSSSFRRSFKKYLVKTSRAGSETKKKLPLETGNQVTMSGEKKKKDKTLVLQ